MESISAEGPEALTLKRHWCIWVRDGTLFICRWNNILVHLNLFSLSFCPGSQVLKSQYKNLLLSPAISLVRRCALTLWTTFIPLKWGFIESSIESGNPSKMPLKNLLYRRPLVKQSAKKNLCDLHKWSHSFECLFTLNNSLLVRTVVCLFVFYFYNFVCL